jgi:inosine/guanosine/xanthosine phosphorylase family protein
VEEPRRSFADGLYGAELERQIHETAAAIRSRLAAVPELASPRLAIVLGSGLGGVADLLDPAPRLAIPYGEVPNVPVATVPGHAGELLAGSAAGIPILLLSGRAHGYEGWSQRRATLLLRACLMLGVRSVVVTNACGGINPAFNPGDVMLINDVINLSGENPLTGPNIDALGSRFVAMTDALDADLRARARAAATRAGVELREGVYLMLAGPSYETRAELRMLRVLGADAVGMSTVPEVLVARQAGARVLGFSLVTNEAKPEMEGEVTHEEVLAMGPIGAQRLLSVLRELLPELG